MSVSKPIYGSNNQSITATTLKTLGNAAACSSLAVDNTSNLFLDALVSVTIKTSASALSAGANIAIYAAGTTDGGTTYGGGEANMGTDAGVTLTSPNNIVLIGIINAPSTSAVYTKSAMSVAQAFGGILPDHWCLVFVNNTGQTLVDPTSKYVNYQGLQIQTI